MQTAPFAPFYAFLVNPATLNLHHTNMRMKAISAGLVAGALATLIAGTTACNSRPSSPDQVREKTAEATAQLKENAKAVAQGLQEGLTRPSPDKPLDINEASKTQLLSLPGIDDATADRVIAGRPYTSEHQLLERKIISREEFNKIAASITVKK